MRPDDWPALLDGYIDQARRAPFAWGQNDCVTFSCGWHRMMTGRDAYAEFREKYETETAAFRIMAAHGVHSMEEAGRFLFGEPQHGTSHIQRGDIVHADGALGICTGAHGAFLSIEGLTFLRHSSFDMGWKI